MSQAQPPVNIEAEQAVLGSMLIDPDAFFKVDTILDAKDFHAERHQWLYDAYATLVREQRSPDLVTLCDLLEQRGKLLEFGGAAYLTDLINHTPTSFNVEEYAVIVERMSVRRRLVRLGGEIAQLGYNPGDEDDPAELAQAAQGKLIEATMRKGDSAIVTMREVADRYYESVDQRRKRGGGIIGLSTGIPTLDRMLYGLQPGRFYTLAGRPGMGKSALLLSIALHVANKGKHVGVFSFEMGGEQLFNRWVAMTTGIDSRRLFMGHLRDDEWPAWIDAVGKLSEANIYIDDGKATLASVVSKGRIMHLRYGLDLLIIDYLQLMDDAGGGRRNESREQEVGRISRGSKGLAMELQLPVLAACQLNRQVEMRKDKTPQLSDLRESGTLEQDSDGVMLMWRPEYYDPNTELPGIAFLNLAKWRDGPTGTMPLRYIKETNQFFEVTLEEVPLDGYTMPDPGVEILF